MRLGRAAGITGYVLTCVLAAVTLVVSGVSYYVVRQVASIGGSDAITSGPSIGAQNILLMGLESRTDWNGNILPWSILKHLHAGSYNGVKYQGVGGNATNTLILIHIPAGGGKAVGFSIPRDDLVTFPKPYDGQSQGKIDQAYGLAMAAEEGALRSTDPHMPQAVVAYKGNEAGRAAAVDTVQQLTGVHIDHFAEVNLAGFYELAKVFNGVYACLKHPVYDSNSGANFRAGYQHLNPDQALAFVRQRDNLTNGDLDRTHRQQAFIDSILNQLRTEGMLSDLSKLTSLLDVAKRYVITDSGWNLLDFGTQMKDLTAGHLIFHTLPIHNYGTWGSPPQDVNIIDVAKIKAEVHSVFYPPPGTHASSRHRHQHAAAPVRKATVTVLNGAGVSLLAAHVTTALARAGYPTGKPNNTAGRSSTAVLYGPGASASARILARLFGVTAAPGASIAAGHVEILLGAGATVPVIPSSSASPSPTSAIPNTGAQGGAVTVNKKYGIPCVD